jgi:hypothetical protein
MPFNDQSLRLRADQRIDQLHREAAEARLARLVRRPRSGFRRSIGRSLVRLGIWLAADHSFEPAHSR